MLQNRYPYPEVQHLSNKSSSRKKEWRENEQTLKENFWKWGIS